MLKTLQDSSTVSTLVAPLRTVSCTFFLGSRSPPSASRWSSGTRFPFLPVDEPPVISCWAAQRGLPSRQLPDSSTAKSDSDAPHAL